VISDDWVFYTFTPGEGARAIIRVDGQLAREETHQGYEHCRRLIVFIDDPHVLPNGLPAMEELPSLQQLDHELAALLRENGVRCRLAGIMLYGGMRDLVFQVEDVEAFERVVAAFVERQTQPQYRFEVLSSEGWDFFDRKVRPEAEHWQQISDQAVIHQLIQAGTDPESQHVLDHTFLGPDDALAALRDQLSADGFNVSGTGPGRLTMSRPSPLDLEQVWSLTRRLATFCPQIGVQYDGWGAAVVPRGEAG
jgi:hypothetical protein